MDILKLASLFEKLAQQPLPQGQTPSKLPAGSYVSPSGEVTIVGDPKAKAPSPIEPQPPSKQDVRPEEVFRRAGWNWEPRIYYTPTSEGDREILRQKGFQMVPGVGLVPPNELEFVQQALGKGWKYSGAFGLVPPEWYDYLKREGYIQ